MRLENDSMTKIEREIDAALKMLGGTTPPAGMTSRIHRSLEAAAAGRDRRGWLFWVPATCAALAAVLLAVFFQVHSAREKLASTTQTAKMVPLTALPDRVMAPPTLVASETFRGPKLPVMRVHSISHQQRGTYRHAVNLLSYPLTQQEKLLVRFAETAGPSDLQALNPEYQAKVEAQQEAEFAAYLRWGSSFSDNGTTEATENTQE
jgi:hypothetical protein